MANIEKIKPGDILHDYHSYKVGNTKIRTEGHWLVKVIEIDLENKQMLASWNGNAPYIYYERSIKKLRTKPKVKKISVD